MSDSVKPCEVHALRAGVEQPDERLLVLGPSTLDEVDQLGVGFSGIGPVAEQLGQRVEVGGVERGADLVDPLQVAGDPAERDPLVVVGGRVRPRPAGSPRGSGRRARAGSGRLRQRHRDEREPRISAMTSNAQRAPLTYHARYESQSVPVTGSASGGPTDTTDNALYRTVWYSTTSWSMATPVTASYRRRSPRGRRCS